MIIERRFHSIVRRQPASFEHWRNDDESTTLCPF